MELNETILKAINDNLPNVTAGELKTFIEQAQGNAAELADTKRRLEVQTNALTALQSKEEMFNNAEKIETSGRIDLAAAKEERHRLSILKLQIELAASQEIHRSYKEFLTLLVKNPRSIEYMNSSNSTNQQPYPCGNGQMAYPSPVTNSKQESKETFETKDGLPGEQTRPY